MSRVLKVLLLSFSVLTLSSCAQEAMYFNKNETYFSTNDVSKAQENTAFSILMPRMESIGRKTSSQRIQIFGKIKEVQVDGKQDLDIRVRANDGIDLILEQTNSNYPSFPLPQLAYREHDTVQFDQITVYSSPRRDNTVGRFHTFEFICKEVYISVRIPDLSYEGGVSLVKSMLPTEC